MVVLNTEFVHGSSKFAKEFKNKIQKVKKELSIKQKALVEITKLVNKKAWEIYHRDLEKFLVKEFDAKGYKRIHFETQDFFKICLQKSWADEKRNKRFQRMQGMELSAIEKTEVEKMEEVIITQPGATQETIPSEDQEVIAMTKRSRMDINAKKLIQEFNKIGELPKELVKKPKKAKEEDTKQYPLFDKNPNQFKLF